MSTLRFDWPAPPLTENQRWSHWAPKAEATRNVRLATALAARGLRGSVMVEVTLTWFVNDRRRRDADNLVPTLKACCDGLVDAGVCADDTPAYMVKNMPRIVYDPSVKPHIELEVTPISLTPVR